MAKNLINQSTMRKQLIASGLLTAASADSLATVVASNRAESQAAAIAARRKELGVKPVVGFKTGADVSKALQAAGGTK